MLSLSGPDTGSVKDLPGTDRQVLTRFEIPNPHSGDAFTLSDKACYPRTVRGQRSVGDSSANQEHRMARVIDLGVVVLDRTDQRVLAQARHQCQRRSLGEVLVTRYTAGGTRDRREPVVQRQTGGDLHAFPAAMGQRVDERDGSNQMRRKARQEQAAFLRCLTDTPEVEHLQIAQPPG